MLTPNATAGVRMGGGSLEDFARRVQQWNDYVFNVVPKKIQAVRAEQRPEAPAEAWWGKTFDVVVVGFGAAGASAALDAADGGKRVLLVDRYEGGGSTRRSGGIYYAGGGTRAQRDAGVLDSPENMFKYVHKENGGMVDDATVRRFCEESPATFGWMEGRVGVPFRNAEGKTVYYEKKTSYPPSFSTLYTSGNEAAHPFNKIAEPAARGNRPFGDYLTGNIMFGAFERAVEAHPLITIALHTRARELVKSSDGVSVVGVQLETLPEEFNDVRGMHTMLHDIGSGSTMFDQSGKVLAACRAREDELFDLFGRTRVAFAAHGVVVATGGFFFNQDMVKKHAPRYHGYMPLGNMGDDGSGILMCERAGAALGAMDRCSAWKFTNPPFSFLRGVLVNAKGNRVGNEDTYGATFADFLIQKHDGVGWLVIDQEAWDEANQDCMDPDSGLQEDQRMQGLANLHKNRAVADTLEELAKKINAPALVSTVERYNAMCRAQKDGDFGKLPKYLSPLAQGPFYAINLAMKGSKYWPTPCMSLGGVKVDGATGLAISRETGKPIPGLYAAGRTAVGINSNYYVSGLSLGDAVFSGRRAGKAVAAAVAPVQVVAKL